MSNIDPYRPYKPAPIESSGGEQSIFNHERDADELMVAKVKPPYKIGTVAIEESDETLMYFNGDLSQAVLDRLLTQHDKHKLETIREDGLYPKPKNLYQEKHNQRQKERKEISKRTGELSLVKVENPKTRQTHIKDMSRFAIFYTLVGGSIAESIISGQSTVTDIGVGVGAYAIATAADKIISVREKRTKEKHDYAGIVSHFYDENSGRITFLGQDNDMTSSESPALIIPREHVGKLPALAWLRKNNGELRHSREDHLITTADCATFLQATPFFEGKASFKDSVEKHYVSGTRILSGAFVKGLLAQEPDTGDLWQDGFGDKVRELAEVEQQILRSKYAIKDVKERVKFTGIDVPEERASHELSLQTAQTRQVELAFSMAEQCMERDQQRKNALHIEAARKAIAEIVNGDAKVPHPLEMQLQTFHDIASRAVGSQNLDDERSRIVIHDIAEYLKGTRNNLLHPKDIEQFYRGMYEKFSGQLSSLPEWKEAKAHFPVSLDLS